MNTQDRSGAQAHTCYSVRCVACGSVIGTCHENGFGEPLTKKEATALAEYENYRSARRREQKLPGAWDYYVAEHKTPTTENPTI